MNLYSRFSNKAVFPQSLVCISCFREIGLSKRTHCLDIETAYSTVQNALCKSVEYTATTQSSLSDLVNELDLMISETNDTSQKVRSARNNFRFWLTVKHRTPDLETLAQI